MASVFVERRERSLVGFLGWMSHKQTSDFLYHNWGQTSFFPFSALLWVRKNYWLGQKFCSDFSVSSYIEPPSYYVETLSPRQGVVATFLETNSLRRTRQIVECSLLHQRAQGRVFSQPTTLTSFCENLAYPKWTCLNPPPQTPWN